MILVIGQRVEGHLVVSLVIQAYLSRTFHLTVDFLGLRRSGSSSQIITQAQDFLEQAPRHRHLGQLERDVPAMADHFRTDLHQLFPQRGQRLVFHFMRKNESGINIAYHSHYNQVLLPCQDLNSRCGSYKSYPLRKS